MLEYHTQEDSLKPKFQIINPLEEMLYRLLFS